MAPARRTEPEVHGGAGVSELAPGMWCFMPGIRGAYRIEAIRYPEILLRRRDSRGVMSDEVEMHHIDDVVVVAK